MDTFIQLTRRGKRLSLLGRNISDERIFIFPLPSWNNPIKGEITAGKPYCLCYQYNVDVNGYGPYGFCTQNAQEIIKDIFGLLYYWRVDKSELVFRDMPTEAGIYFYGDPSYIERLQGQVNKYRSMQRKNEMLERKGIPTSPLPPLPLLFTLSDSFFFDGVSLDRLVRESNKFFIRHFYTPEAGEVLILFDDDILDRIKIVTDHRQIDLLEVDSINKLNSW